MVTIKPTKATPIKTNVRLTSAELGSLWTSYMNDSMAICILKYFVKTTQNDDEIKSLVSYALSLSEKHIATMTKIYNDEHIPVPDGFTEADVDLNAPALFSETFHVNYLF